MRKLLFFIGTLVVVNLFVGCSKEETKGNPEALIGTWECERITEAFRYRGSLLILDNLKGRETLTFYADKRVESTIGIYTCKGTYATKGYSITIALTDPETGTSIISGPGQTFELKFTNGEKTIATIKEQTYSVSENELTLEKISDVFFQEGNTTYVKKTVYKRVE